MRLKTTGEPPGALIDRRTVIVEQSIMITIESGKRYAVGVVPRGREGIASGGTITVVVRNSQRVIIRFVIEGKVTVLSKLKRIDPRLQIDTQTKNTCKCKVVPLSVPSLWTHPY